MDINVLEFIPKEILIMVAVIYALGMFLKKIPNVPDWTIPIALLFISIGLTIVYTALSLGEGFTQCVIVNGTIYGILAAWGAVFSNEVIKQVKNNSKK